MYGITIPSVIKARNLGIILDSPPLSSFLTVILSTLGHEQSFKCSFALPQLLPVKGYTISHVDYRKNPLPGLSVSSNPRNEVEVYF